MKKGEHIGSPLQFEAKNAGKVPALLTKNAGKVGLLKKSKEEEPPYNPPIRMGGWFYNPPHKNGGMVL